MVMSAARDINDRKRADKKFRALLESAPDAMVIAGPTGNITLVNSQVERLFGYQREELLGTRGIDEANDRCGQEALGPSRPD